MHHRPAVTAAKTAATKAGPRLLAAASTSTTPTTTMATPTPATTPPPPATPPPIRVPVAETVAGRTFRYVRLPNHVRAVVVQDPAAAFGAVAAVVQAGYLSDGKAAAAAPPPLSADAPPPPPQPQPLPLHGLAHFLEHAVHLGSTPFPAEDAYKQHLAKHGGSSNASTSAATTRYHARCAASGLQGAVERLGAALAQPLLKSESLAREVENVHAEYSRNRNSDSRRALQLHRSSLGPPLSGFSTGSIETLREAPEKAGVDLPSAMRELWREAYVGPAVTAAVVGPQPVDELEAWVRGAFSAVRATVEEEAAAAAAAAAAAEGAQAPAPAAPLYSTPRVGPPGSGQTLAASCFPPGAMARLVRVAPMRELRELELTWHVPYSTLGEPTATAATGANGNASGNGNGHNAVAVASAAVAPWSWAAHVVGHEALGSAAELLKRQGLITSLTAGVGEDVRLSAASPLLRGAMSAGSNGADDPSPSPHDTGLMTWHVSVDLTAEGDARAPHVAATIHRALELLKRAPEDEWRRTWEHARECAELRFQHRDRTEALRLAQGLAASAAHYAPADLLAGPSLYQGPFDAAACRAFLGRLSTPGALVVTHISPLHRDGAKVEEAGANGGDGGDGGGGNATALQTERWYGARYASEPLLEAWLAKMRAYAAVDEGDEGKAATATTTNDDSLFAPKKGELFLPPPAPWALPQDLALRREEAAAAAAADAKTTPPTTTEPPTLEVVRKPELVYASPGLHTWHALDAERFGVPKAQYRLRLVTPATYASGPKAAVTARLLARILTDVLEPELYDAHVAGSSLDLSTELDGLSLTAAGFNDVLPRLLERALKAARSLTLEQVERRFVRVAGHLRRDLVNWRNSNPQSHAEYAAERLLQPGKHHAEELLRELCLVGGGGDEAAEAADVFAAAAAQEEEQQADEAAAAKQFAVTPGDVLALCRAVFGGGDETGESPARAPLHVDALLYGNLSREEGAAVAASLERALAPPGIPPPAADAPSPPSAWPTLPVVDLASVAREESKQQSPAPLALEVANPNPTNANHAMVMVTQLPPPDQGAVAAGAANDGDDEQHARQAALLDLFVQASAKACFHELRTVKRLGYSVALYSASYGGGGRPMAAHAPVAVDAAANDNDDDDDDSGDPRLPRPIRHLCVRVQSPSTEPRALAAAAVEWLSSFRATLESMPEEDLASHVAALRARYLEPARSLADAASRAWRPLKGSRRDFAWRERKARAAALLGRADLLAFYDAHLDPARAAALVVMVKGGAKDKEGEDKKETARATGGGGGGGGRLRPPPLVAACVFGG